MSIRSDNALNEALKLIENCNFNQSLELLKDILACELDDKRLVYAIRCCDFWKDCTNDNMNQLSFFEQGEWLLGQWKKFQVLIELAAPECEKICYSDRKSVV